MPCRGKVSAIYLLRKSPCVSSILPSIVVTRADNPQTMVYMNLQLPDGTARRSPADWWSLTPPSHPCPCGRSFSSSRSSCRQLLLFSEVGCPVLPGLSSRTAGVPAADRNTVHCLFCYGSASSRLTAENWKSLAWRYFMSYFRLDFEVYCFRILMYFFSASSFLRAKNTMQTLLGCCCSAR